MSFRDNQRMFMNKILFFMVVVAVPSISFGGSREVCEVILKNLNERVPALQSEATIQADQNINKSGISNLHELIVLTTQTKGDSSKSSDEVLEACRAELWKQTRLSSRKNRNGNSDKSSPDRAHNGGNTGGALGTDVGLALGAASGAMELDSRFRIIRSDGPQHSIVLPEEDLGHEVVGALATCDVLTETESCGITPFSNSLAVFGPAVLETAKTLPLDTQHCSCIEAKATKEVSSEMERSNQVTNELRDMNTMIATAFGKKFINDYATHLEDIRYFTKNAKQVFSSRESRQSDEAENLRCSKPSDFKAAVQKTCGRSVSDSQINSRMAKIFGELGQAQGFQYLSKIDELVMVNTSDDGRKFRRGDFDIIRNGMVKEDKNIRFADNIVATLLKDKNARRAILATDDVPKEAILKYLTEQIRTDSKFFNRYLDKELLGERMFNEMSNQFKDTTVALNVIRGKLDWAMEVHPGFESLMKNKKIFDEASDAIKNSSSSAIDTLETSDDILKPDLIARCDALKNNLAQFLCTDENSYVGSTPKNELRHMITNSGRTHDLVMADLAICRGGNTVVKSGPFAELFVTKEDRQADILERLGNTKLADQKNLFTKIMLQNGKSGDSETRRALSQAAEEGYRNRRGLSDDSYGRKFDVADSQKMSFFSPETERTLKSENSVASAKEDSKTVINNAANSSQQSNEVASMASPAYVNNYSAALKDYQENTGAKATTQEKYDPRNDLREFLSNKENKESVDRLMKETDDSRVADLARLREESEKNREQLLKLASDNEKLKLKQMQDQLAELEQKRSNAVSANVAPEEDEEETDPRSSGRGSRDIASVSSGESSGVNSGSFSGGKAGGSASGSGSAASSAISNARNELSNGLTGNNDATSSEPVVISAAAGARSGSLEIKSTELSKEILNFLETEPDVQTLIKMRQSGMIYKYKVMENGKEVMKEITIDYKALNDDVKKLIEQKIADSGKAGSEAKRLSAEIKDLRRAYSYNALKIILGEQMKARR